jgi:hypothetical protein
MAQQLSYVVRTMHELRDKVREARAENDGLRGMLNAHSSEVGQMRDELAALVTTSANSRTEDAMAELNSTVCKLSKTMQQVQSKVTECAAPAPPPALAVLENKVINLEQSLTAVNVETFCRQLTNVSTQCRAMVIANTVEYAIVDGLPGLCGGTADDDQFTMATKTLTATPVQQGKAVNLVYPMYTRHCDSENHEIFMRSKHIDPNTGVVRYTYLKLAAVYNDHSVRYVGEFAF